MRRKDWGDSEKSNEEVMDEALGSYKRAGFREVIDPGELSSRPARMPKVWKRAKPAYGINGYTKFSKEVARQIADAVGVGMPLVLAAQMSGVSVRTVRNWVSKYSDFRRLLEIRRAQLARKLLERIIEAGHVDKYWRANAYLLSALYPEYFGPYRPGVHMHPSDSSLLKLEVKFNVGEGEGDKVHSEVIDLAVPGRLLPAPGFDLSQTTGSGEFLEEELEEDLEGEDVSGS